MSEGRVLWNCWGQGEPVVLLHGGSGSWTHWARNIAALADLPRLVCVPDLPGFGDSDRPPGGHDADAMPPWIESGLESIVGDQACDLVGFSFGAMVATMIAVRFPARVRRLVLVGAPALSREPMNKVGLRAWNHLPDPLEQAAIHRHNLLALMVADERCADAFTIALHSANLRRDRLTRRRLARSDILLRLLSDTRCPVYGIWGERDALYRDRLDRIEPALATAPGFRSLTLLPGAGHWVQYEDAPSFNRVLSEVLADSGPHHLVAQSGSFDAIQQAKS